MIGISKESAYFSATNLLVKKYTSGNAKSRTTQDNILDKIRQTDPENADALEKRLNDDKQVIAQLRGSKAKAAHARKADAAEKISRIKQQIQMLKMMGGDPKIVAKQIARLAKELASAAREYASAGGTISPDQTESADTASSASNNNIASLNTFASSATDSGMALSAGASATIVSVEASVTSKKDEKGDNSAPKQESESTITTGTSLAEGARQYQETQKQKLKDDLQKEVAKMKEKSSEAIADREFANDVSIVAARLKALAKLIKQRPHQQGDQRADQDINKTDQALAEVEKSISDINRGNMTSIGALA
jgi:hypothetical protein